MHVVGDRPVLGAYERHAEVTHEDLDGHHCLLLADAIEGQQPLRDIQHVRPGRPDPVGASAVLAHNARGCRRDPARHRPDEAMERRWGRDGVRHGLGLRGEATHVEMTQAVREQVGRGPRTLCGNALREEHAEKEGLGGALDERISLGQVGERPACLRRTLGGKRLAEVTQRLADSGPAVSDQRRGPFVRKNLQRVHVSFAAALHSIVGSKMSAGSEDTRCVGRSHMA